MSQRQDRILTTHVGSLARLPALLDYNRAMAKGEPYDPAAYETCLAQSIDEIVRLQVAAGIDIVSDGEFSKGRGWSFYLHERITGVRARPLTPEEARDPRATLSGGRDRIAFAEFYAEADKATGLASRVSSRFIVDGPLVYDDTQVRRDIANLKQAAAKAGAVGAFLPVVAPASAIPSAKNEHYPDDESLLFAIADVLHQEYQAIVDAGLIVQIDDGYLPYMHEKLVPPMTLDDYKRWAQLRIDALNHALRGIPPEQSRYHLCWGSWNGPHVFDVEMRDIVDLMLKVNVGAYQFEAANVRHEHEWRLWERVKLPEGKVLIPGVISHVTNLVEHPELVAQRIVRLAKLVGRENVMGGSDCGFSQGPFSQKVHPTIAWAKLRSLAEGARLATAELWGRG